MKITDFPLYVQGLEFRQNSENVENNPQSVIISQKVGTDREQKNELSTTQVVNNVGNIQYVRVKSHNQLIAAQ